MSKTDNDKAARVRYLRERKGMGLIEARQTVEREDLLARINAATTIDDLKAILIELCVNNR